MDRITVFIIALFLIGCSTNAEKQKVVSLGNDLEMLSTCDETWKSIFDREKPGLRYRSNFIEERYLSYFEEIDRGVYEPKTDINLFGAKILSFNPFTAGMSPGVSVSVNMDFSEMKESVESLKGVTLERCNGNSAVYYCGAKVSKKKSLAVIKTKSSRGEWITSVACVYPYRK
ncbi:hypothetical protein R50073_11480 [Maricurvus nonylphenolicus]|uniref:hypothetical protein n=1 Tax=Maricurvus nonylphenolicus TaxID=1008307 RepID=UPI0036F22893